MANILEIVPTKISAQASVEGNICMRCGKEAGAQVWKTRTSGCTTPLVVSSACEKTSNLRSLEQSSRYIARSSYTAARFSVIDLDQRLLPRNATNYNLRCANNISREPETPVLGDMQESRRVTSQTSFPFQE